MRFSLISDIYHKTPYWNIDISSIPELFDWYENQPHTSDAARDIFKRVFNNKHASTGVGICVEYGLLKPENYSEGAIGVAEYLNDMIFKPKFETLQSAGRIFINANCGFCSYIPDYHTIHTTVEREPMDWPEISGEIRFLQWAKGGHWYVKVGPHDVIVDGEQKWNSRLEAREALAKFLSEKKGPTP